MFKRFSQIFFVFALFAVVSACSPAQPTAMIADVSADTIIDADSPLRSAIQISKISDARPDPVGDDVIAKSPLVKALELSLQQHTMLNAQSGPLMLDVFLVREDLPFAGISMTVSHAIKYVLRSGDRAVFDETIASTHTTQFSEAFVGATRVRLAVEGSAKKNISQFIRKLVAASKADPDAFRSAPPSS